MEKTDFFIQRCQTEGIKEERFGICDDEDKSVKTPAYVDYAHQDKWVAIVENYTDKSLNFTAIDNCIMVYRENGDKENCCDAMLTNQDHIVFIELKDQRKDWISHAVDDQLQTTIDSFKANHDISKYKYRRAFVCNRQHPLFQVSYKERMSEFYRRNKIRLNIQNIVIFK